MVDLAKYSSVLVASTQGATEFLSSFLCIAVHPKIQATVPQDPRQQCLWGYFQRLLPLVRSIARLDQVSLFQLVVAANRSLFEILVDVIYLHHKSPADVAEKIEAWEDSARFKAADAALKYARSKGEEANLLESVVEQAERARDHIAALRAKYWPHLNKGKGGHPDRWTGKNLGEDCRLADRLTPVGLEEFYEIHYRQMNWSIHGSGFADTSGREVADIEKLYSRSLLMSGRFALVATGIILAELGRLQGDFANEFGAAKAKWTSLITEPVKEAGLSLDG